MSAALAGTAELTPAQEIAVQYVERHAPEYAARHVRAAFAGDADAAFDLAIALPNRWRGIMAESMWLNRVPLPAYRVFLAEVWEHDHRYLIAAAQTRRRLAAMFRYAAFELPASMPDTVRVWRGTSALPFAKAAAGYSWTTHRDTACWFAMRFAERNGRPLVLTAEVRKSDIAAFCADRSESEAVILGRVAADVDGSAVDWAEGYARRECRGATQHTMPVSGADLQQAAQ